jgi:hypothetical protein
VRKAFAAVALAATGLFGASLAGTPALASANTQTVHLHNVTQSGPNQNPCTGAAGTLTQTFNAVFHITKLDNGTKHVTSTVEGTFSFDATDPSQPDYTGRFTDWFGGNLNQRTRTLTDTFSIHHAVGSDGSILKAHEVFHATFGPNGVVVAFDRLSRG